MSITTMKDNANLSQSNDNVTRKYTIEIVWKNVLLFSVIHAFAFYGLYLMLGGYGKWQSIIWGWFLTIYGSMGILAGCHRLWSHRAYKANLPLRMILAIAQTVALQNDIYHWCRNHRTHHKYSDTDSDPHNSKRGFFFSHMGWLMCKKLPEVNENGKTIDMTDLWADPVVRFQRRYYLLMVLLFWGVLPVWIPMYLFGESFSVSFYGNFFRYIICLHHSWSVNSFAHLFGSRPYDKSIQSRDNKPIAYCSLGEGYHNYHHAYPYDYSASELGWKDNWNPTTAFIDFFAWIGWVSDRKTVGKESIEHKRQLKGESWIRYESLSFPVEFVKGFIGISYPMLLIFMIRACIH